MSKCWLFNLSSSGLDEVGGDRSLEGYLQEIEVGWGGIHRVTQVLAVGEAAQRNLCNNCWKQSPVRSQSKNLLGRQWRYCRLGLF